MWRFLQDLYSLVWKKYEKESEAADEKEINNGCKIYANLYSNDNVYDSLFDIGVCQL